MAKGLLVWCIGRPVVIIDRWPRGAVVRGRRTSLFYSSIRGIRVVCLANSTECTLLFLGDVEDTREVPHVGAVVIHSVPASVFTLVLAANGTAFRVKTRFFFCFIGL